MRFSRVFCVLTVCLCLLCGSFQAMAQKNDAAPAAPAAASAQASKVNLNSASADQLMSLPGIGPATAKLIIEYRTKSGKFNRIEEIMNVKGIGEKKFRKIKDRLAV